MNPLAVGASLVAGGCFALAITETMVWYRRRAVLAHGCLAAASAMIGLLALGELWMMSARSPEELILAQRWFVVPVDVLMLALMGYVLYHLKAGRRWLAGMVVVVRGIDLVLSFTMPAGPRYRAIYDLIETRALGLDFVVPQGSPSPWMAVGQVGTLLFVAFVMDAAITVWRRRSDWQQRAMTGALVLLAVLGAGQAFLIFWHVLDDVPLTISTFSLPLLFVISLILSDEVTRAFELSDELDEHDELLQLASDAAGFGVWEWDVTHGRIVASARWRRLLGFDADEAVTFDDVMARVHPEDRAALVGDLRRSERGPGTHNGEFRLVLPDGTCRWVSSRGRFLPEGSREGHGRHLVGAMLDTTALKKTEQELRDSLQEVLRLREQIEKENIGLREQFLRNDQTDTIVGESEPVLAMLALARRVAATDSTVLITGETGTGKELLAQAIHDMSSRRARPMVKVNCAALPAPLIESELFGRERGAYTGAMTRQMGRFELADRSTLFLDEVGELPLELQTKLLRVLQDGQFERLGSTKTLTTDVRIVAATNRDLPTLVSKGGFREDLYHRLNVFPIQTPPLRERPHDIPLLVWRFISEFNQRMGKSVDEISKSAWKDLMTYPWPGNIRELRNLLERAMILSDGKTLRFARPALPSERNSTPMTLEENERRHIIETLERTAWRISGQGGAADLLDLPPTTLHSRMKKLGIVRPSP